MLRAHGEFLILKPVRMNNVPIPPRFDGDVPVATGIVRQVGSDVPVALMDAVVIYFPTAGHPFRDTDGSEYVVLRHTNVLAYFDQTP